MEKVKQPLLLAVGVGIAATLVFCAIAHEKKKRRRKPVRFFIV
ncbi:hypothetical protein [Dysgonomonas sp. 520]|nr:hypothetical protein [Dysgonomonas sp. 520]